MKMCLKRNKFITVVTLISVLLLLITTLFMSCSKKTIETDKVSFRLPWIRFSTTAGLEVAQDKGFFQQSGIQAVINAGSVDLNPTKMVVSGSDQFGILEPAQVIVAAVNQKLPVVILALKCQESPFALMSLKEKNITHPHDLVGKVVGYNPLNDVSYLSILKKFNIDHSSLKEVPVQFDLTRFFEKKVDVWPSYVVNEPLVAKSKGFEINLIRPDDYGIHLYEHCLFTTKDMIEKNPGLVKRAVKSWLQGWHYALQHPEEAVDITLKHAEGLTRDNQIEVLKAFIPLMASGKAKTRGFGWVDLEMIETLQDQIYSLGIIKEKINAQQLVDNSFLKNIDMSIRSIPQEIQ